MNVEIGVMQGRLVPRYKDRYQAFPKGYWQAEFHIAKQFGLNRIEFILDYEDAQLNPLLSEGGISQIQEVIDATGVGVSSVCADYFMVAPFHSAQQKESEGVFEKLIVNCMKLGVSDVTIPCVDSSSLKTVQDFENFKMSMKRLLPVALKNKIKINLETDLAPVEFRRLIDDLASPQVVRVNYDIGNSASLGFDPDDEFEAYGGMISVLHIKDRTLGGGSVPLGSGSAKIERVWELIKASGIQPTVIMQAARKLDYLDDLILFRDQLDFVRKLVL